MVIHRLAAAAALILASAQLAPPPAPLVEKIDVNVINVDVTVTDRKGNPVRNLTRADFDIFEDGIQQQVSNFYVVEDSAPVVARTAGVDVGAPPPPERTRRKVLVLVDSLNTDRASRARALDKLEKFINEHFNDGRYDWSVATVDSRVHLVLPMTSEKSALAQALNDIRNSRNRRDLAVTSTHAETLASGQHSDHGGKIDEQPEWSGTVLDLRAQFVEEARNFDEESRSAEQTMVGQQAAQGIAEAARAFATTEGRKIILLVTGDLPLGETNVAVRVGDQRLGNHADAVSERDAILAQLRNALIREANASNTSLYIVSAGGLDTVDQSPVTRAMIGNPGRDNRPADVSTMFWLATETGGAFLPGNKIERSFADFDRRSANYYALGYIAQHPEDGRYRSILVRVKGHSDYKLQYRDGYSGLPVDIQLMRALRTTLGVTMQPSTLPLAISVPQPQYRGSIAMIPITAAMKMESLQYVTNATGSKTRLHAYVSVFNAEGTNVTLVKSIADISLKPNEPAKGPMTVTLPPLALKKGSYRIVVAVRDELTDQVGVVVQKLDV